MPIDFPTNPTLNQTYTFGSRTWSWNGSAWDNVTTTLGPTGAQGTQGLQGTQGIQGLVGIQGFGFSQSQGTTGIQGLTGIQGNTGPQGTTGSYITTLTIDSKTSNYTINTGDEGKLIEMGSASALTLSIPTDATFNFAVGTQITIIQTNSGQVTISAVTPGTTTVVGTPGTKLRAQWSSATIVKRAANSWVVLGDTVA